MDTTALLVVLPYCEAAGPAVRRMSYAGVPLVRVGPARPKPRTKV
jgi:hypothetical protein